MRRFGWAAALAVGFTLSTCTGQPFAPGPGGAGDATLAVQGMAPSSSIVGEIGPGSSYEIIVPPLFWKGDLVLYYHSVVGTEVVGICEVVRESYPDPTTDDDRWVVVDLAARKALARPVTLAEIKEDPAFADIALIKQSRLSVMPLSRAEFDRIVKLGSRKAN